MRTIAWLLAALGVSSCTLPGIVGSIGSLADVIKQAKTPLPWIDTHTHPVGVGTECVTEACIAAVESIMDSYGMRRAVLMHPPSNSGGRDADAEASVLSAVSLRPSRFFYAGGGSLLNPWLQDEASGDTVDTPSFIMTANRLVDDGAVMFGETASLHMAYNESLPYMWAPANSTLYKELADIAAKNDIPLLVHMDAVPEDLATPEHYTSSRNPDTLAEDVTELEELLAHNRDAKIVWAHVGKDTTGELTPDLVGDLLSTNKNLYIELGPDYAPLNSTNALMIENRLNADWISMLSTYRDRVVLGSDVFWNGASTNTRQLALMQKFLHQLPPGLATQFGCTNPVNLYGLSGGCDE